MPHPILKTALPDHSQLHAKVTSGDFLDCYQTSCLLPADEAAQIITDFPGWAQSLVRIRNLLTAPFGLKRGATEDPDQLGIFPVEMRSDDEIILGFNDRHLDFRVSVLTRAAQVFLATWVRPHNIGGRLYLGAILPFHILIVRNALARVARADLTSLAH